VATMIRPLSGSVLSSPSTTFSWTSVSNVDQYRLEVGSVPGGSDYFDNLNSLSTQTTATVSTLPCDGRPIYVQLITKISGYWLPAQPYNYTAASGCALILTPPNGSTLPGTNVTFSWSGAPAGSEYQLDVSDRIGPIGQGDIFSNANVMATSMSVPNIPCDGRTIYVQLATLGASGMWQNPGHYTYRACKMLSINLSPTSLPKQGGQVTITVTMQNLSPALEIPLLNLTESGYPNPPCFYNPFTHTLNCPAPTSLYAWPYWLWPGSPITISYPTTIAALPPAYQYARGFDFTATLTLGGTVLDSASATLIQY